MSSPPRLGAAAVRYAQHGWCVLPLYGVNRGRCTCHLAEACQHPGKHPLVARGVDETSKDPNIVAEWWRKWPHANIGIAPGPSGLIVIDVDDADGERKARALGLFTEPTWSVSTGRGRHLYFLHPNNGAIGNRRLAPHVDVRADAGYVVAPPSTHASGKRYRWEAQQTDKPLPLPPQVAELLRQLGRGGPQRPAAIPDRIRERERNDTLTSFAGTLRRRGLSKEAMLVQLEAMNVSQCDPPLEDREVQAIAASVGKYPAGGDAEEAENVDALVARVFGSLPPSPGSQALERGLSDFAEAAASLTILRKPIARGAAIKTLKALGVDGPARLVDAALVRCQGEAGTAPSVTFEDVEPAGEPQDGCEILNDLSEWFRRYIYFPDGNAAADAAAGWTLATWCVDRVYFAPLLILTSPTKAAGKTTFLDLLSHAVRRGHFTSAFGATGPVVFRLNDAQNPTFLIDEAERLGGRHADRDLVNLLNQGHRRGGKVDRCKQMPTGGYDVESFDAFGFRALALIGKPWDTLLDRGIVVRLERKPRGTKLARFGARAVKAEGQVLASRVARWAGDCAKAVGDVEGGVPRPTWLSDRGCDNWSSIFAVAAVVGGAWPDRLAAAAKALQNVIEDDGDRGERVLLDIGRIFEARNHPAAILSGEIVTALNKLEESSWADERDGKGLSPQRLAALLRPFRIRPRQARVPGSGAVIRGYWWVDVDPVLERYTLPAQSGTVVQLVQPIPQNPRENAGCTAVPVVPVRAGGDRGEEDTTLVLELDPDEEARIAMREGA